MIMRQIILSAMHLSFIIFPLFSLFDSVNFNVKLQVNFQFKILQKVEDHKQYEAGRKMMRFIKLKCKRTCTGNK